MKPGEIRNAPATRIAAPSLNSRPGTLPAAHRDRIRRKTERPARWTITEPTIAVDMAMASAQRIPIRDSTQKNVAISASAINPKAARNRIPINGTGHTAQSMPGDTSAPEIVRGQSGSSPIVADLVDEDHLGMEQETTTSERPTPPPPPPSQRELTRSSSDRVIGGVASGIAHRFDLPVWLVRVLFALFVLGGGFGLAVYLAGWAFIRADNEETTIAERFFARTTTTGSWVGVALIFVALIVLLDNVSFLRGGVIWAVALLAVGILLYSGDLPRLVKSDEPKEGVQRMTTTTKANDSGQVETEEHGDDSGAVTPPPPPTPGPTPPILPPTAPREKSMLGRVTFGVMAIALGVLALLDNTTTLVDPSTRHYLALAMTVLGVGLIVGAFAGRARWLALVGLLGLPFLLGSPALEYDFQDFDSANVTARPDTFSQLQGSYDHSIGEIVIDLTNLDWDGQDIELEASLGIGELRILIPEDVAVSGTAEASIGHVEFDSDQSSGLSPALTLGTEGSEGSLELDATVGIGQVDIDRVPAGN